MIFYSRFHLVSKLRLVVGLFLCSILINFYQFIYHSPSCSNLCPYKSILSQNQLAFDKFHTVPHYADFICPQNFRNLADWVYGWPEGVFEEELDITTDKGYRIGSCLVSGSIIYVKSDYLEKFFSKVYPYLNSRFVLITGQSDVSPPDRYLAYLDTYDSKIVHWFGQNAETYASENGKFTPIPIGINCYEMGRALQRVREQKSTSALLFLSNSTDPKEYYSSSLFLSQQSSTRHITTQLLLVNFQRQTDPTGTRTRVWKTFCDRNTTSNFVKCIDKLQGVDSSALPTIYARNRQYPFWLSPRGNGIDCHRTWEALYLDVIPIVWNSTLNSLYTDLPIIVVNDDSEITEHFLLTKLTEILVKKRSKRPVYRYEKLAFGYWRRLILSKSRHSTTTIKRENQCWRAKSTSKKRD
ncbi:unnamed protein product [Adineta ricciae]|uniref:Uncharacterized protein n=1 Tax=Adineta ricciae TaxID=249248 RepID=A0A815IT22_ADIRI|nr:unnamed protein product [Adineta ricciae]CAF1516271.1 unnamed protein product [Adineta ricciae]